jgi:hypothetical protein
MFKALRINVTVNVEEGNLPRYAFNVESYNSEKNSTEEVTDTQAFDNVDEFMNALVSSFEKAEEYIELDKLS